MTLPDAHETARNAAARFGKPFRVYRLPAWPPAAYGATSLELPHGAEVLATYPSAVTGPKAVATSPEPAAGDDQRSLF